MNYNENIVCVTVAPKKTYKLEAASYGTPSMTPLTLDEIRYVNNSSAFKTGLLEFPEELEDAIYEELRIDKSNVLKLKDIKDILINPNKEGLQKIISISTLSDFDRVRGQFQKLKQDGYKLTLDVADLIKRRSEELFNNQIKSNIKIDDADLNLPNNKRVDELERQLEEMKALLAQALLKNDVMSEKVEEPKEETSEKKKPGRPSTKKTD